MSSEREEVAFGEPLLEVEGLTKYFQNQSGYFAGLTLDTSGGFPLKYDRDWVKAVDDVSFTIRKGETLGLVGESGCGKSTLARTILRLLEPTEGSVYFKGEDLAGMSGDRLRTRRQDMQMIFQDPQSSLDPRMKVGRIVEEPMKAHGLYDKSEREERARELLEKVGLDPQHYNRYPYAFSGGQRQRVNLARALSVNPDFIVCDEPVSALDVSIQAQVLNTMNELQEEFGLTYLFIAHDLSVIRHISDRVAVMYLGHIVELADKEELFENPQHPYTRALLESIPVPDPRVSETRGVLEGDVPSPINPPSGCRFRTRCPVMIQPEEFDMSDDEWADARTFMREVERRTFEPSSEGAIVNQFFGGTIPGGDAGSVIQQALEMILSNEWEEATSLLRENFAEKSICARERPDYVVDTIYGNSEHFAACHHNRDGYAYPPDVEHVEEVEGTRSSVETEIEE